MPPNDKGIYVEILICADLARIWQLTQTPELHGQWDLRFSQIEYLPKSTPAEPQRFLYLTRIGFGLAIRGMGESVGSRSHASGESTSSLRFSSVDPKSLIRQGSGYWRYIPTPDGVRFLTWYDYDVRYGQLGRAFDRVIFRPLIGWATAWSFDRLRLWAEFSQSAKVSRSMAAIYAITRLTVAFIWIWHGLVPKLLYSHADEQTMLQQAGVPLNLLPFVGTAEILFGLAMLLAWRQRIFFLLTTLAMVAALVSVAVVSPQYLIAAFNPVTLNLATVALSLSGWLAWSYCPTASRCLRTPQL